MENVSEDTEFFRKVDERCATQSNNLRVLRTQKKTIEEVAALIVGADIAEAGGPVAGIHLLRWDLSLHALQLN
jgi:hypothetical protein